MRAYFLAFSITCASRRVWRRFRSALIRPTSSSLLSSWKSGSGCLLTARRSDVREFLQQLFSHQVDGRSVGRKLSALRHLYRYLLLDKRIEHDPTLNIESPRQWKVLPKSLARDEVESTLASPAARVGETASQIERRSGAGASRSSDAGTSVCGGAASFGDGERDAGGSETGGGIHAGARQGGQGTHCAARQSPRRMRFRNIWRGAVQYWRKCERRKFPRLASDKGARNKMRARVRLR